jgi:hypothetical protein
MINYGAGFARRGISGEIILKLSEFAKPQVVIFLIAVCCYFSIYFAIVFLSRTLFYRPEIALCLSSPLGLLFSINDSRSSGRKEIIILALFAAQLLSSAVWQTSHRHQWYLIALTWSLFLFFLGRGLFLFWLSLIDIISYGNRKSGRALCSDKNVDCFHSANGCIFDHRACKHKGCFDPANCNDVSIVGIRGARQMHSRMGDCLARYQCLGSAPRSRSGSCQWRNMGLFCRGVPGLSSSAVGFLPLRTQHRQKSGSPYIYSIMLPPVALTIPLYIFALDWGRWFNVTYLFMLMSILFFIKMGWLRRRICDGPASSEPNDKPATRMFVKPLLAVAVTLYLVSWSVPVCCGTTLGKGILGVAERAVSRIH